VDEACETQLGQLCSLLNAAGFNAASIEPYLMQFALRDLQFLQLLDRFQDLRKFVLCI